MVNKDGKSFYSKSSYKKKQSAITKSNWQKGYYNFLSKKETRKCKRKECSNKFEVIVSDPKIFCSRSCSAKVNNTGRVKSRSTKQKISESLTGRSYPERQGITYKEFICSNPECQKQFSAEVWKKLKYCCPKCAMRVIGGRPTSPKAARAKAGIRPDIDVGIYFYSRWEANYARILNLEGIEWIHQPKRFKLIKQHYTPDFYLPETNTYVEIKNFLGEYSRRRDEEFRRLYPKKKLDLILKVDYKKLEEKYSHLIPEWEFS